MSLQPPIPAELWEKIPPAAQVAILALVQQYERRLQNLQKQLAQRQQSGIGGERRVGDLHLDGQGLEKVELERCSRL